MLSPEAEVIQEPSLLYASTASLMQTQIRHSLRANAGWNLLGSLVYASCQWGMLICIARFTDPTTVGRFALALAVTAPVIIFSQLQLRGIQATDAKGEYSFGHYLGLRLLTTCFALVVIAIIVLCSGYARETAIIILLVGLGKASESISDVFLGALQRRERMGRVAVSQIIKGTLSLLAMAVVLANTGSLTWAVAASTMAWAAVLLSWDIPQARAAIIGDLTSDRGQSVSPSFGLSAIASLAWTATPLGLVMLLNSLNSNTPRYLIEHQFGQEALGIFAALAYLIVVGTTLVSSLGQAASPRLANLYAAGEFVVFRQLMLRLCGIGISIGIAAVLVAWTAGAWLLRLLYGNAYAEHTELLILLMCVGGLLNVSSLLGYGMTAVRIFRAQLIRAAIVFACSTLACLLLIPGYGLVGAVTAMLIGAVIQLSTNMLLLYRRLPRQSDPITFPQNLGTQLEKRP